jgi:hypothetical protein
MGEIDDTEIIPDNLIEAAIQILQQPDPWAKARLTNLIVAKWRMGLLSTLPRHGRDINAPDRPARSDDKARDEVTLFNSHRNLHSIPKYFKVP